MLTTRAVAEILSRTAQAVPGVPVAFRSFNSTSSGEEVRVEDLPPGIAAAQGSHLYPQRGRRRGVADELYENLVAGRQTFWQHVHPLFISRDLTRADLRLLVRRGLATTSGNYRAVVQLFGMTQLDYRKSLNFLAAHDCAVDYREFRPGLQHQLPPFVVPAASDARAVVAG